MDKFILKANELDGYLTLQDKENISTLEKMYSKILEISGKFQEDTGKTQDNEKKLITLYDEVGNYLNKNCNEIEKIQIYPYHCAHPDKIEASRIIAKLRNVKTKDQEFVYYIQRAYEALFRFAWLHESNLVNYLIVKTPVTKPVQNFAVHKIHDVKERASNTVMCVMLRGALLPSIIFSKEIEDYSSNEFVTPFALFKIKRNDTKKENNMEYILDLENSFFDSDILDGKDLIFADPMNATGGSLITIIKYLENIKIKPRSIQIFNIVSALKGALRTARAVKNCKVFTLWMDIALNEDAYIMPGLGDAGDRINGKDIENNPRNIIQLIADYGSWFTDLYRSQIFEIEKTVLGRKNDRK